MHRRCTVNAHMVLHWCTSTSGVQVMWFSQAHAKVLRICELECNSCLIYIFRSKELGILRLSVQATFFWLAFFFACLFSGFWVIDCHLIKLCAGLRNFFLSISYSSLQSFLQLGWCWVFSKPFYVCILSWLSFWGWEEPEDALPGWIDRRKCWCFSAQCWFCTCFHALAQQWMKPAVQQYRRF